MRAGSAGRIAVALALGALAASAAAAGASYEFDGNGVFIDHGRGADLQLTTGVSICAWVKSDQVVGDQVIAVKGTDYELRQADGGAHRVAFAIAGPSGSNAAVTTVGDIRAWNWVCGAWGRDLDGGRLDIYVNGVAASSYVSQPSQTVSIVPGADALRVAGSHVASETWDGHLAYVHVWNRKISAAEAREVMLRPGSRRKGLVLYSPMTTDISFPSTPILDDFDRADGPIGAPDPSPTNWTHSWAPNPDEVILSIENNEARTPGLSNAGVEAWNPIFAKNTEAYFTLTQVQQPFRCNGLYFRHPVVSDGTTNLYLCEFCHAEVDSIRIWVQNGGYTMLTDDPFGGDWQPGDVLGMRVVGNVIECYRNGELVTTTVDTTFENPGYMTFFLTDSPLVRGDDFGGGTYNAIRDLSGGEHHTTSARVVASPEGPPVSGGAR